MSDELKQAQENLNTLVDGYNQQVDVIKDLQTKLLQALVIIDDLINGTPPSVETAKVFLSAFKVPAPILDSPAEPKDVE